MGRRPVCLACLLLILMLSAADLAGFPFIRGNPPDPALESFIQSHPDSLIAGVAEKSSETEFSQSVYLKDAYLIYNSEKFSIANVKVFLEEKKPVPSGASLVVSGKLERVEEPGNPGEFDSRQYYAGQHIYYIMKKARIERQSEDFSGYGQTLIEARESLTEVLRETAGTDAGVFEAMLLGDRSDLSQERKISYQMAGIIHILAISGLHISIIGMGFYELLIRLGCGIAPGGILTLILMLQYGAMTGAGISTMRAVAMMLLTIGARISGRSYDSLTALSLSAILLLLNSPAYLADSSFLLSFSAVLGINVLAPIFCAIFGAEKKILKSLLSSAAVWFATLPVVLNFYGEVSVAGVFLNLLVLPTAGAALGSGLFGMLAGVFNIPLARLAILPGRFILFIYELLCSFARKLPFCTWIPGAPGPGQIIGYYGMLLLLLIVIKVRQGRPAGKRKRENPGLKERGWGLLTAAVLLAAVFVLTYHPHRYLKIICMDVGQGDGILLETPEGGHFLIDCGSSNESGVGQYRLLPCLKNQGIDYLDAILVSHTDGDHINGIQELLELIAENLTSVRVGMLVLPRWEEPPEVYRELTGLAEASGIKIYAVGMGDAIMSGGVRMEIMAPENGASGEDANEDSMVVQVEYGEFQGLFTGDIGEEGERKLIDRVDDVDFLKVAHHGSRYSSTEEFLEKVKPELGVISCSDTNNYGHPSQEAIQRLEAVGCRLFYTMESGAVTITTDGRWIRTDTFRKSDPSG